MTPAEEMREAARLMRERAALVPPPPWHALMHDIIAGDDGGNVIASSGLTVRAQYVASWHPGVALALADWLDVKAVNLEVVGHLYRDHDFGYALAVARAYLGAQGGTSNA